MTLVLACLTSDAVYQVSDRRLTSSVYPYHAVDDETNKAVVVNGRVTFGYTGLSTLGSKRMDDWLAEIIGDGPTDDMAQVVERIKNRANVEFQKLNIRLSLKRHAFQGVGWFRLRGTNQLTAGIVTIDNAIDHQKNIWLDEPLSEFQINTRFRNIPLRRFDLDSIGFIPSNGEKNAVVRLVRKCIKHRRTTFRTIVQSLIISLQWLSSRHSQIGPGLMCVCLPRKSVEEIERTGEILMIAGPPDEFTPTFQYVSATGSRVYFGPHFVGGGAVMTGFRVIPL